MKKEPKTKIPEKKGPEKKIRAGPITATIWRPKEPQGKNSLVVFEKSYKDKEGKWASTNRFTATDLPIVAWLAHEAFDYLIKKKKE